MKDFENSYNFGARCKLIDDFYYLDVEIDDVEQSIKRSIQRNKRKEN